MVSLPSRVRAREPTDVITTTSMDGKNVDKGVSFQLTSGKLPLHDMILLLHYPHWAFKGKISMKELNKQATSSFDNYNQIGSVRPEHPGI